MSKKAPLWLTSATVAALLLLATTWAALQRAAVGVAPAATGTVVINEIAWGGTAASSWDEWLELHNTTAAPITLNGWTLTFGDGSPDPITLSGIIPAQGYFLLERAQKATDLNADLVYGGGQMHNAGERVTLQDFQGRVIDTANGDGGAWPAGSGSPDYTSMERIDPAAPDSDDNWAANDRRTRNGRDANGYPINGTPRARNSAYTGPAVPAADLVVAKIGPLTAAVESLITYTLRLSNAGSLTAAAVRLTDRLPAAVTFVTATQGLTLDRDGDLLLWTLDSLSAGAAAPPVSVTARVGPTASGSLLNVVTATTTTTETHSADNRATWETHVGDLPREAHVLISALLYDGYQLDDRDEAVQLTNVGETPADLAGWELCDRVAGGSCATIVSGTLDAGDTAWLAYWASDFYTSSGFYPAYAVKGLAPGTRLLSGAWPRYANSGGAVLVRDADGQPIDTLVYADGDVHTPGWSGPAVRPWAGAGNLRLRGQVLYRRLNEATALPVPDTDSAVDWAQYAADPVQGRRVRYPGWDLESFFRPLTATEKAQLTVGVAPDNSAAVLLSAIESARRRIEISVYTLRHPTVIQKLVDKAGAGISVTLLLEGDPAGLAKTDPRWYQQMWACQELQTTGHGACWFMIDETENRIFARYPFMHAKYTLIDRAAVLISSQNLTPMSFPDDAPSDGTAGWRGTVLWTDAPSVVARVAQVFDHDLDPLHHADLRAWSPSGSAYGPPPPGFTPSLSVTDYSSYTVVFSRPLTLSDTFEFELFTAPEAALRQRDALLGLLARAGAGDRVYVEALDERAHWGTDPASDPSPRMEAYLAAARRGARVRVLLNDGRFDADYYDPGPNLAAAAYANTVARREGLDLIANTGDPTGYGIHNKMVLVWLEGEGGYAHLGSLNGGESANKANRELALQVRSDRVYAYLKGVFDWDWNVSNPSYLPLLARDWTPPPPPVTYPLISEVLYNPSGAGDGGEWVELYNPTEGTVDVSGWHLGDVGPGGEYGSGLYTFPSGTLLPSDGVLLVARQADDVRGFVPHLEFLVDPRRDDPDVPNMLPAGGWEGFGFALGNTGDQVLLLDRAAAPVDVLVYGDAAFREVVPHPGVSAPDHSLERRPAIYDSDDCRHDFVERYPPDPGEVSGE